MAEVTSGEFWGESDLVILSLSESLDHEIGQ
jgi:hypothetical protein